MAKVLLIEDDPILINIYKNYLSSRGHEVKAIEDGGKAQEIAIEYKPDLILLDLMVPKIGGSNILENLRASEQFKKIPILVYTNLDSKEKEAEILAKGATEFSSKAKTNFKDFTQKIEKYLL